MAKRRCFSIDFFNSNQYLNLTNGAKALYLGLLLYSDDEGVAINHLTVMRLLNSDDSDFNELLDAGLIIEIDGVYIIKHWHVHNQIQPSKKTESLYQEELSKLILTRRKEYEFIK